MARTSPAAHPGSGTHMSIRTLIALLAFLIVGPAPAVSQEHEHAGAQATQADGELTVEQWREDLRAYDHQMRATHRDLFNAMSEEEWDAALADLDQRLPELERHEIVVELGRITSMVGGNVKGAAIGAAAGAAAGTGVALATKERWAYLPAGSRVSVQLEESLSVPVSDLEEEETETAE